ncbi:hybrid sensor histidine kinase/response regulator [Tichowtungia aerotolerans]|uniref:histidine kinase n=1 Tax=Tichowtungia aerotolerans TaxID=2697043 RepID=A0A6P1M4E4_9BACT|nr:response regulator [Tichowtungia aerotolerans]QHI69699.1 response regulator [Tichowtungia aerotolerans]
MEMDKAFLKKLRAAFAVEAQEHLEEIATGLRSLKSADEEQRAHWVEVIFRETHSLKGAARAVNKPGIETLCQAAEGLFAKLQKEQTAPTETAIDLLYQVLDLIEADLKNPETLSKQEIDAVVSALKRLQDEKNGSSPTEKKPVAKPPAPAPEEKNRKEPTPVSVTPNTLRVSQDRLEQIMRESEELLSLKLSTEHRAGELQKLSRKISEWKKTWSNIMPVLRQLTQAAEKNSGLSEKSLRPKIEQLQHTLESIKDEIDPLELQTGTILQNARNDASSVARFVDSLHGNMRELMMMPFSSSLSMMHKVVRDLSNEQNKPVELEITGGNVEADRRILEGMKDPFLHLIRNSIDHGIESPEERAAKNKPEKGTVSISIAQIDSGKVHITVEDDGRGLDLNKLRKTLISQQIVSPEDAEKMTEEQLASSIFFSGLSTSEQVTSISGRGIGTSVVREKVESLGGSVSVTPRKPWGTSFSIILPVGLATFRGILVQSGDSQFVLPTPSVERMLRVPLNDIKTVEGRETITVADQALPLETLSVLLEQPSPVRSADKETLLALVICAGSQRFALEVDEVLREQEVLVKGLGPQLMRVRNVSGIAVLGTGELAPILNVHDLIKSSIVGGSRPAVAAAAAPLPASSRKKSVMVAEDSITSRMLLKNVLESSGYHVATAVDGAAAFAALKTGEFDALVSDVDMPRMNGFVLTERVRADRKLAELPVVLVTSLASQEDKERGIEAGASAYIVKSSFDQSNLVSVLNRLI